MKIYQDHFLNVWQYSNKSTLHQSPRIVFKPIPKIKEPIDFIGLKSLKSFYEFFKKIKGNLSTEFGNIVEGSNIFCVCFISLKLRMSVLKFNST